MISIKDYVMPQTLAEAYSLLTAKKANTLIGGCTFLHLGSKNIHTAIDLSSLDLAYINDGETEIEIGAMTTFSDIEHSAPMCAFAQGVVPKSVKNIVGTQLRNMVTVGATVYSRYGFSDFITALLTLHTDVVLYKGGRVSLEEFLKNEPKKDILEKIIIKKTDTRAIFLDMRNSYSDFAIVNAAVSNTGGRWKVVSGARPMRAMRSAAAEQILEQSPFGEETAARAAQAASEELRFGTNMRGSAEYRKTVAGVLLRRCIMEVGA